MRINKEEKINKVAQIIPMSIDKTRAIIHTIDSFGGVSAVVWEYIANGIDYIVKGTKPEMEVLIEKDKISFADQGRGMDVDDLTHFFKIHAENKDRKSGSYTYLRRGYFGTGGFSIFSIAKHLKIISVKNGKLYSGELSRADIVKGEGGFELEKIGVKTDLPNGTKFEATELNKEITPKDIIHIKDYVLKQMKRSKGASVWINTDPIEYKEPAIEEELTKIIYSKDTEFFKDLNELGFGAGEIKLTLKKTKRPLLKGEYGVAVLADGKLLEICSPGIETKKHCDYIIGDAEIKNLYPNLEKFSPPLFDQTRRLELKIENKYVVKLRSFIGVQLEEFEKKIAEIEKKREETKSEKELNKKLAQITEKANEFLKDELDQLELNSSYQQNLSSKSKKNSALKEAITKIIKPGEEFYKRKNKDTNPTSHDKKPFDKKITKKSNSILSEEKTKKNNSGGLKIIQQPMGEDWLRADFHVKDATIIINTDFPPIKRLMKKGDYENKQLDYLLKEIASTELAVAITQHLIGKGNYGGDISTAIVDLRKRINDFSLKFDSIPI